MVCQAYIHLSLQAQLFFLIFQGSHSSLPHSCDINFLSGNRGRKEFADILALESVIPSSHQIVYMRFLGEGDIRGTQY